LKLTRVHVDPDVFDGKQGAAELRFILLKAENEGVLEKVMAENPKTRRRVYKCVAAMGPSPTVQDTASEWLRDITGTGKRAFNAELKQAKEELLDGLGGSIDEVMEKINEVVEKGFTHGNKFLFPTQEGYQAFTKDDFLDHLSVEQSVSNRPMKTLPDATTPAKFAAAKIRLKDPIDYWGPVAGHQVGLHDVGGRRVLCTKGFELTQGVEGDWSLIEEFLDRLFGRDAGDPLWEVQKRTFLGWAKAFRDYLLGKGAYQGQFIAWVGEAGCGKTWFQDNILPFMFTGRYFPQEIGRLVNSQFNRAMGENEIVTFSDADGGTDWRSREKFADALRKLIANPTQSVERKGVDATALHIKQRIVASLNETGIASLPILKDGVEDKLIYMKVYRVDMWNAAKDPTSAGMPEKIISQIPAFVHAIDSFELREEEKDQRYGVVAFHHPTIVDLSKTDAPWELFADLVGDFLRRKEGDNKIEDLRAREVFEKLQSVDMFGYLGKEIKVTNIGHRLKELYRECGKRSEGFGLRVSKRVLHGCNLWTIEEEKKCNSENEGDFCEDRGGEGGL